MVVAIQQLLTLAILQLLCSRPCKLVKVSQQIHDCQSVASIGRSAILLLASPAQLDVKIYDRFLASPGHVSAYK
jgi:hypothetical protein